MKTTENKSPKTPWPTKDTMQQVYQKQLWGAGKQPFYSGEGSHLSHILDPYVEAVSMFLRSFHALPTICDLGCGDFNVGKKLVPLARKYIGIDIVPELISYLQENHPSTQLQFDCKDLAKDPLPSADIVILRQVLQHLSNAEIGAILKKLDIYKYLIITEHIPVGDFEPNLDIISGQGIRLKKNSGVVVNQAPFYFKYKQSQVLSEAILKNGKGIIKTTLYTIVKV